MSDDELESPILDCYVQPGWNPRVVPSSPNRDWMDATPERFIYRCLPLSIGNSYGWHVLCSVDFSAYWDGSTDVSGVKVHVSRGQNSSEYPVSIFGQGVLTFHVPGIFRTSPNWNLYVTGPTNFIRDGIAPLTGIVESDWSIFTFTMNYRFTRINHYVEFKSGDPIANIFPIRRNEIENIRPKIKSMLEDPDLREQFSTWSASRDAFHARVKEHPVTGSAAWQKHYFKGLRMNDESGTPTHQNKLRVKEFEDPLGINKLDI